MKALFTIITVLVMGCATDNLRREGSIDYETFFYGRVFEARNVTAEEKESIIKRGLVGTLSGGILVGIGASILDSQSRNPKIRMYQIKNEQRETIEVFSHSYVDVGDCVEVQTAEQDSRALVLRRACDVTYE